MDKDEIMRRALAARSKDEFLAVIAAAEAYQREHVYDLDIGDVMEPIVMEATARGWIGYSVDRASDPDSA